MDKGKRTLTAALLAVAALTPAASSLQAKITFIPSATYAEPGDAGQTLATAQPTGTNSTTALTAITGTFNGLNDADLYIITITAPTTFSATTANAATTAGGQDTALFLFNSAGVAIATNDDAAGGTTLNSALAAGNALYASLAAGTYYLGISESGNEAINFNSQLLFNGYPAGDTTATRGAAAGVNPTTLATFNGNSFGGGVGAYEIDLTGAATAARAVPEPTTWAALGFGASAAALTFLRRRRQQAI